MSVSTTGSVIQYSANGVTTAFAFPYLFIAAEHLIVVLTSSTGVETTVTPTSYVVTGAGSPSGGTVTFLTPPANGNQVTIYRNTDDTQQVDYVPQDNFPAQTHETAIDKLTLQSQDRQRMTDRSIRVSESSSVQPPLSLSSRKGKLLGFNDQGNAQLDISLDALRTIILANPVGQLTNVTDYGTLGDVNNYLLDYGTIT